MQYQARFGSPNGDKNVGKCSPKGVEVHVFFRKTARRALSKISGRPGSIFGSILGALLGAFSDQEFVNIEKICIFGGIQEEMELKSVFGTVFGRFFVVFRS